MSWRSSAVRSILCLIALLMACSDTKPLTQIVVAVDSDWDGLARFEIEIEGFVKQPGLVRATLGTGKNALPRRVVLVHDGGPLGPLSVTVSAFVEGSDDPVAIEPRTGIRFVEGKTLLLKIDLLFECIRAGLCDAGQACLAGPTCVSSAQAAKLVPWEGDVDMLATDYHVKDGDVFDPDAGLDGSAHPGDLDASYGDASGQGHSGSGGGGAGGTGDHGDARVPLDDSGIIDSGPPKPIAKFDYVPVNVDPTAKSITALERADVNLDCKDPRFDSSDLSFDDWCGPTPVAMKITQAGGGDAALLVMGTLAIASDSTLHLTGSLPVILLVFGDAQIGGAIDAGGHGSVAGPGADLDCNPGVGRAGAKASSALMTVGAGGGSGGGFGSVGGDGGGGGSNSNSAAGGEVSGAATLAPLRGGCSGGPGGLAADGTTFGSGGGGGGALQIATAGRLQITGLVSAAGGGGGVGVATYAGGGGGGSGGAVLLEGLPVEVVSNAWVSANGGGGGAGQSTSSSTLTSAPGLDGSAGTLAAPGGAASTSSGDGGNGAALSADAQDGSSASNFVGAGAGGGGGGLGRIRINQASSCLPAGTFSPVPSVGCDSCGVCTPPPEADCTAASHGGAFYYLCPSTTDESTARSSCESVGMHLVQVNDNAENDWLAAQVSGETWIGATDAATEGTWLWEADGSEFWSGTSTGAAVGGSFASWASGQPDDGPVTADCATLDSDALWRDHYCSTSTAGTGYPYVCE